jgi:hypothetical protein
MTHSKNPLSSQRDNQGLPTRRDVLIGGAAVLASIGLPVSTFGSSNAGSLGLQSPDQSPRRNG